MFGKTISTFIIFILLSGIATAGPQSDIENIIEANIGGVALIPAGEYPISHKITLPAGTTLIGETGSNGEILVTFKLINNVDLSAFEPVIDAKSGSKVLYIKFDGNSMFQKNVPTKNGKNWGQGFHNFIKFEHQNGLDVAYCEFYNSLGDGVRVINSNNVDIHNNKCWKLGHDSFFMIRSEGLKVHDNYIQPRVSSGIRLMDCSHSRTYHNTIKYVKQYDGVSYDAGPNIQIQQDSYQMSDNEVINNVILNSCGPGFWIVDKKGGESQLDISWNLVSGCGSNHGIYWAAGVVSNGFDSYYSHNVFDGCYLGGFLSYSVNDGWEHNARTIFQNNIFLNTLPGTNIGDGGYGIYNKLGQDILSQNNCFYNNHAGNTYGGTVSDSDYFTDPKVSNYAGWTWTGSEWECPTVNPSEMGAIGDINTYDPISEDEIQEMDDIFDILKFEFITSGLQANKTIYVNGALYDSSQAPKNVNMTLEQHELGNQSYTLLYGPSAGLTQVKVECAGKQAVHTLMIGESRGSSIYYSNCSIWSGDIYRIGDSFYFDGMIEPNDIDVTCYTVKGSFKPDFEVVRVEQEYKGLFNKFIILYLSILVVLLSIPVMVVFILFSKRF